jgi:hypothetical protein
MPSFFVVDDYYIIDFSKFQPEATSKQKSGGGAHSRFR